MENFFSILGGMGTKATESFIRILNQRTVAHSDQEYLNYVLFNHATIPDRTAYILDETADNPLPYLFADIEKLNVLQPNFIVLTCNTAHYFYDELQAATDIPLLHMPREAVQTLIGQPDVKKVAFFGTAGSVRAGVYETELRAANFDVFIPDETLQAKINQLIYHDIKERSYLNQALYYEILYEAVAQGCDRIILGCTELSLMEEFAEKHAYPVVDPQAILVDQTIARAQKDRKAKA